MVTREVLAYVRTQQQAGFSADGIKDALVRAGWGAPDIEEILRTVKDEKTSQQSEPSAMPIGQPVSPQAAQKFPTPAVPAAQQTPSIKVVVPSVPPVVQVQPEPAVVVDPRPTSSPVRTPASTEASRPRTPVTPTLRALTAIDSQFRSGVDEKTVRTLLLGVGWDTAAIDEAFLAVEWGESLLNPSSTKQTPSPDARAPKLGVIDAVLVQVPTMPTRRALIAIDSLSRNGVSKGNIRTLLLGVGWDARTIDEAFLAVEWRENPPSGVAAGTSAATPMASTEPSAPDPDEKQVTTEQKEPPSSPLSLMQSLGTFAVPDELKQNPMPIEPEHPSAQLPPIVPNMPSEPQSITPAEVTIDAAPEGGIISKIFG